MDSTFVGQAGGDAMSMKKVTTTRGGVREGMVHLKNSLYSDVPKISSALDPSAVSITGTATLTQTKPSGPLGQFQVCLVKPLARFLTVPYLRAQRILQFSRTVHVFHMQSMYIARQAIHLVILLNDLVDVQEGPDDEQYQERIDLEDELIELFDAMREWGARLDEGLQVDYDQGLLKINQQYAQFFRERFYFHNVRNSADDFIYGKLVAYDRKTIDFRKWQYSRPDSTSMDVDLNGSKAGDEGNPGHASEAYIESVTSSPDSRGSDVSTGQEMLTHPADEGSARETRWLLPDPPMKESEVSTGEINRMAGTEGNENCNIDEKSSWYPPAATPFEPNPDAGPPPLVTAVNSRSFGVGLTPSWEQPLPHPSIHPLPPKDQHIRYSNIPISDYYGAPASFHSGAMKTHQREPWDGPSSFYDSEARSNLHNPSDFEDYGLVEGKAAAIESGPTVTSVSPPEFRPMLEGRLFTAHDATVDANCEVHPTARLLFETLPLDYREVFKNCPMYPGKHLEFVKFLKTMSNIDITQEDANPELLRPLGIQIPTEEGDKRKWKCAVIGCDFKDTLQHLYGHLQQKKHIGLPMFACQYCKRPFNRANDRNRHEVRIHGSSRKTGASRSTRGISHHNAVRQIRTGKTRAGKNLNRPESPPSAYGDMSAKGDAPSSSESDDQIDFRKWPYSRPATTSMDADLNGPDNFQPTINPRFTPGSQPVKPQFNHPTGLTYGHPGFDIRGQDPGRSSTYEFANFAGNFYGDDPSQDSHRRPHDSRRLPPYLDASKRPEAWGVTGIKEEGGIKEEEEEEMRVDLESGVVAMDVTP